MKVRGQGDAKPAAHEREGDRRKVSKVGRGLQCLRDNEKKQKKKGRGGGGGGGRK